MLSTTMLALTRSIASRVAANALRPVALAGIHRAPALSAVLTRRAFSTTPAILAPAATKTKTKTKKATATKSKSTKKKNPKTAAKKTTKARGRTTKAKTKKTTTTRAKAKKAAPKKPVSTRVPLSQRPPKKPASPYFIFLSRTRTESTKTMEDYLRASKEAGAIWRKMTDAEKKPYQDEFKVLYQDYVAKREKWFKDPKNASVLRLLNKDRRKRGKQTLHRPEGTAPKRPMTGFIRFFQELKDNGSLSEDQAPTGTQRYVIWAAREAGARWKALPAVERERYKAAYHAEKRT